jgi:serine phosphatase RsbU (regulator of sigma subunit)
MAASGENGRGQRTRRVTRMTDQPPDDPLRLGSLLSALNAAPPYELTGTLHGWLAAAINARSCTVLLADYEESSLEPLPGPSPSSTLGSQQVDGSAAGLAYREQRVVDIALGDGDVVLFLPITQRAERVGVLEVRLPSADALVRDQLADAAHVLAYVVLAARRYTDEYERVRRRRDLKLAAELQWELLPVLAYCCAEYDIAGSLEPAYEIGGDTFDYAVSPTVLTVALTDAMGHGLRSALLGSLAVTTMRNVRRRGGGVVEQATEAAGHLVEQFSDDFFVAAVLLSIDVPSGAAAVVNAGQQLPIVVRAGRPVQVTLSAAPPLGMFPDTLYVPERIHLEPGDRLVLVSDGIFDANPVGGEPFGEARLHELLGEIAGASASETVRLITSAVVEHRAGKLQDDATAVCLDWHGNAG